MSLIEIADTLLLRPLQLLFEFVYAVTDRLIDNPGASIVVLSLVMNFLVLPLYRRADAMQEEERQMELRLQKGVVHIKKTFSGDEQMMMLRTYYRQNDYKPAYVLRGAISLFLEIPFFIAAYRFLSGLRLLDGVAFGLIADLGSPDGMLRIAGRSINVLPFIMTAVNLVSCVIFTKGSSLKTKLQLYGMAVFFLVFLYTSPAGLVFYWTLNNTFSLIKTIFYKVQNPRKKINIIFSTAGVFIWIYGFFIYAIPTPRRIIFFAMVGLLMQFPAIGTLLKKRHYLNIKNITGTANRRAFLSGGLFLAILTGILIPSSVIKSSPQEFINDTIFYHPVWFIVSSFCMALGVFVLWMGVFYWLAGPSIKPLFDRAVWIFSGIAMINYMFFHKNFGNLTSRLKYESELEYTFTEQLLNLLLVLGAALALYAFYERFAKRICEIWVIGIAAVGIMLVPNIAHINSSVGLVKDQMTASSEMPHFTLSRTGKNVIVLMLDRAMGEFVPYIFDEKPELKEQFDGFTYYSNTIAFGKCTNFGIPPLLGGYEYTPVAMNKREDEPLVLKHNEALKVMPVLFDQNDYQVTVVNPTYANYQWIPDLTIYDDYPDIKSYITGSKFVDSRSAEGFIESNKRNFFCYSILKSMPLFVQETVYNNGKYNEIDNTGDITYSGQHTTSIVTAEGINSKFMESYSVLESLSNISDVVEEDNNTFLFMANDTTHEPMLLQMPDYVPSPEVDNTEYADMRPEWTLNGHTLKLMRETHEAQVIHYHANMAAMIQLGKWFDFMRAEGVYDNTRIILVSDHGQQSWTMKELILDDDTCASCFYPLLMVKDFGESGFATSDEFMTNADVPTMAFDRIIADPVNPFTGKAINSDEKTAHDQYIIYSDEWDVEINNGNTFLPAKWYSIHDDIWDNSNWEIIAEDAVLSSEE